MMKKLLLFLMMLAFALPAAIAGEKTIVINRNEGIYKDSQGVYYCTKGGITMTFSSGMNNINYLVEHQQVVFDIFSTNYVIKKIKFNCLDNTTNDNLDCFYWGPSTIHELGAVATYTPTGTYTYSGYIGTWVGGSTPSKYIKFVTEGKPVRFGSVEITIDKEFGDIYDKVTSDNQLKADSSYVLVSQYDSRALGMEKDYGDPVKTFSSTPVTLFNNNQKVKVTDEVQLIKLQSSGNSSRPWYLKVGDNYIRRRSGTMQGSGGPENGQGYNIYSNGSVSSYEEYFRVSISVTGNTNQNALISFYHNSSETAAPSGGVKKTFAIRHYNGGDLFRDIDYSSNNQYTANQRVYLYKPAQTYYVTTNCLPDNNSGYITLGEGVLNDGNGNFTSQQFDNVNFFVGPTEGWGVGTVTVTNLSTNEVTTLTPTATSDFGNDYSFEMPAGNVNITANFLQPYNIDTICNPTGGGVFNFISGSTDFNGQHKSIEGQTVTFKPIAADGYSFNSVTITNNGETTTLTPDQNGVYSFVMPGNNVTLTANFDEANDLYLLGTANGETTWHPYGPKFTFDGASGKYYIDVYFKGGVAQDDPADPAYGYFSLTKKIDEGGNWDNIRAYRLAAENNHTWVEDGYTNVALYGDRPENAFKIPPGVYRIEVNAEMTQMSIIEKPLTLTFTPGSGASAMLGESINVSFTSNLDDLVHAINPNEVAATYNYSTTNGNTTSQVVTGNSLTITEEDITTVNATANIGYISVPGTANYEIIGDLYMLGTVMGRTQWAPSGPKFNYDTENEQYYLDVYYTGQNSALSEYDFFSLATHVSDFDWTQRYQTNNDWTQVSGRLAATSDRYPVNGNSVNVPLSNNASATNNFNNSFMIPSGVYRVTVNKQKTLMSITQVPLNFYMSPAGGTNENPTIVDAGDAVRISSDMAQIVHAIDAVHGLTELALDYQIKDNTMQNWQTGNEIVITREGLTTVDGQISIGFIIVEGSGVYRVDPHSITTQIDPEGAGTISITSPTATDNLEIAGQTVTFSVSTNTGYALDGVEVSIDVNGEIVPCTDNGDGTYSFVMPKFDVTIHADYHGQHTISTQVIPEGAGSINVQGYADNNETVTFTITANTSSTQYDDYYLYSVTVTNNDTQETTQLTATDDTYSFVMPDADVTITAEFRKKYLATIAWTPADGGSATFVVNGAGTLSYYFPGTDVTFSATPNAGFVVQQVQGTLGLTENQDGTWSFTMPSSYVNINVIFEPQGEYQINLINDPAGAGSISLTGHVKTENGNFYSDDGKTVNITPVPAMGWAVDNVTVVDANNNPVTVVNIGGGTFSMEMPASDVTVTVHYVAAPLSITTQVNPEGTGEIHLMGDAADNDEFAGNTVSFTVEPNTGYVVDNVYYTYGGTNYVLTPDNNGTYSFEMPGANVVIVANMTTMKYVFRRVTKTRDIIEGGTYIYVNRETSKVLSRDGSQSILKDNDILEWIDGKNRVKVNGDAAMFQTVQVQDTTYQVLNDEWGDVNNVLPYKAAYLQCTNGQFIGILDNPDASIYESYRLRLFDVDSPEGHDNLRALLRIQETPFVAWHWANLLVNKDVWSYYGNVWPYPLLSADEHNQMAYYPVIKMAYRPISLYKLPQPFTVTTHCVEENYGQIELSSGVDGNIAIDGDVVTFKPIPEIGYGVTSVTVTINGTNETLEVTRNKNNNDVYDGTYSFEMPAADVTITAYFDVAYKLTVEYNPEDAGLFTVEINEEYRGRNESSFVFNDIFAGSIINLDVLNLPDHYRVQSVTMNESTYAPWELSNNPYKYDNIVMPAADLTIVVNLEPAHTVTKYILPDDWCGDISFGMENGDDLFTTHLFNEGEVVHVVVDDGQGYKLDHLTVVTDNEDEQSIYFTLVSEAIGAHEYMFTMPDEDVNVIAWFVPFTPLSYIENGEGPENGSEVTVDDELIGVWSVRNLLWAKDQSPYKSIDHVDIPDDQTDYVRQNMKLQKQDWDQSNWVILEFAQPEDMEEADFWANVAKYVDHKIEAGTIHGTYHCDTYNFIEDDVFKVGHTIFIDLESDPENWPVAIDPQSTSSLGYPGYKGDPREEQDYNYMYNHYIPSNFMRDNIGGRFGDVEEEGVAPGENEYSSYPDARFFFMNPKDQEVAQVWAVWYGSMDFYDEYSSESITADVFEMLEPARVTTDGETQNHNVFDLNGAFYVPHWDYNRLSSDPDDYGKPSEDDILQKNTAYLFHIAIQRRSQGEDDEPQKAPRRDEGEYPLSVLQAKDTEPWTHYMVYPLDLGAQSIITVVREVMPHESTEIDSIRYYNVMGQESDVPFDGINIRVIRYKDGSMISNKIFR